MGQNVAALLVCRCCSTPSHSFPPSLLSSSRVQPFLNSCAVSWHPTKIVESRRLRGIAFLCRTCDTHLVGGGERGGGAGGGLTWRAKGGSGPGARAQRSASLPRCSAGSGPRPVVSVPVGACVACGSLARGGSGLRAFLTARAPSRRRAKEHEGETERLVSPVRVERVVKAAATPQDGRNRVHPSPEACILSLPCMCRHPPATLRG